MASGAPAETAKLKIGDPAPQLETGKWIQGDPVKSFAKDKAYIVEFWSTWCGPCRVSIPHLNELHNKFKDKGLVVIGQNVWERDETLVEPFVKKMGDKMTYRVAMDKKSGDAESGAMAENWMKAANQNGIPAAFLVNKEGKIAWIGHPMSLKESVIEEVISGKYDLKKAAEKAEAEAKNETVLNEHSKAFSAALRSKNWDDAEQALKEIEKLMPADERGNLDMAKLQILFGRKDLPAAYKLVEKISDADKNNSALQNQLAWSLATRPDIKEPNKALLEKLSARAEAASGGKDASVLDTVARIKFMTGNKEEAIKCQEKAVAICEDERLKEQLTKTLASYKEGKLPSQE